MEGWRCRSNDGGRVRRRRPPWRRSAPWPPGLRRSRPEASGSARAVVFGGELRLPTTVTTFRGRGHAVTSFPPRVQFAGQVLAGELLVLSRVGGGHAGDPMGGKQYAQPQPSTPKLFDSTWRSEAPASNSAAMSRLGIPHRPNPPAASEVPLPMSAIASAAEATDLSMPFFRSMSGKPGWQRSTGRVVPWRVARHGTGDRIGREKSARLRRGRHGWTLDGRPEPHGRGRRAVTVLGRQLRQFRNEAPARASKRPADPHGSVSKSSSERGTVPVVRTECAGGSRCRGCRHARSRSGTPRPIPRRGHPVARSVPGLRHVRRAHTGLHPPRTGRLLSLRPMQGQRIDAPRRTARPWFLTELKRTAMRIEADIQRAQLGDDQGVFGKVIPPKTTGHSSPS